jgi:hypothetical protein
LNSEDEKNRLDNYQKENCFQGKNKTIASTLGENALEIKKETTYESEAKDLTKNPLISDNTLDIALAHLNQSSKSGNEPQQIHQFSNKANVPTASNLRFPQKPNEYCLNNPLDRVDMISQPPNTKQDQNDLSGTMKYLMLLKEFKEKEQALHYENGINEINKIATCTTSFDSNPSLNSFTQIRNLPYSNHTNNLFLQLTPPALAHLQHLIEACQGLLYNA